MGHEKLVTVQFSFSAFINLPASCQSLQCSLCLFITEMKGYGAWKKLVTVQLSFSAFINLPASCQSLQCSLCLLHFINERQWGMEKTCNSSAFIFCIHKPASKLSVTAMQLMFIHYGNERLFSHKKLICNTMSKLKYYKLCFYV